MLQRTQKTKGYFCFTEIIVSLHHHLLYALVHKKLLLSPCSSWHTSREQDLSKSPPAVKTVYSLIGAARRLYCFSAVGPPRKDSGTGHSPERAQFI
mmetsp:Transcript_49333/g.86894  ORF Transcript_49333/g.86894 Transcript_49333/m.86894 type:complete len:96 (+) Transcript_49333:179-466(+)